MIYPNVDQNATYCEYYQEEDNNYHGTTIVTLSTQQKQAIFSPTFIKVIHSMAIMIRELRPWNWQRDRRTNFKNRWMR